MLLTSAAKTKCRMEAPTSAIIDIAIPAMKSFAVSGIASVFTPRPEASCISPPPARNAPRMRAIAKAIAPKTAANPMNIRSAPR